MILQTYEEYSRTEKMIRLSQNRKRNHSQAHQGQWKKKTDLNLIYDEAIGKTYLFIFCKQMLI